MNPMIDFARECDHFYIRDVNQVLRPEIKSDFIYNHAIKSWTQTQKEIVRDVQERTGWTLTPLARAYLNRYLIMKDPAKRTITWPEGLTPRPYQIESAKFVLSRNRSYLALDPRLGKTIVSVLCFNALPGRTLIICPPILKRNWAEEFARWNVHGLELHQIKVVNSKKDLQTITDKDHVVIIPDSLIASVELAQAFPTFQWCFIDEAHRYKTPTAQRTQGVLGNFTTGKIQRGVEAKCKRVVCLSGTPMPNRPIELWPVLISQAPEAIQFLSYKDYGLKYCAGFYDGYGYDFKGSSNFKELVSQMTARYMRRLRQEDVLTDLPERVRELVYLETNAVQYRGMFDPNELSAKIDLTQIIQDHFAGETVDLGMIAAVRRLSGERKVDKAIAFLESVLEETEEKVLVFAYHRNVVGGIVDGLTKFKPASIMGGMDTTNKNRQISNFISRPDCRLLVANIEVGSLGLDLSVADRVVFVEYDWVPENNKQAENRVFKLGKTRSILAQYLVESKSIDEVILKAVFKKMELIDQLK